jgi:3',5'-cyclic AMP phosphodiesterase CpdA
MSDVLALAAVALAVVAVAYRRQIYRRLTRLVGGPAATTAWQPFGAERPALHLAVVGDVGHPGRRLDAIGAALARIDEVEPFDGLLLLGDNVYPSGDPDRLPDTVFRPFAGVLDHAELHAILGNHDVKGPGAWGRSRMAPTRRNWAVGQVRALGMPGRWWARHLRGDVLLIGLDSTLRDHADQHAWLEHTLASATERWRIVAVHHPPYSAGYQGSSATVRRRWAPLFARYGVQLVLSGHDHDYQRSVPIRGVTYVVSGGASSSRRTGRDRFTAVSYGWLHAVELAVFPDRLVVRAIGPGLEVGDEVALEVVTSGPRTWG